MSEPIKISKYELSDDLREQILKAICEGKTIKSISQKEGMPPYHTIFLMMKKNPNFEEEIRLAREVRADYLFDQALDMGQKDIRKGDVPAMKLKLDILKYAASIDNPRRYNTKRLERSQGSSIAQIIVHTGIVRD